MAVTCFVSPRVISKPGESAFREKKNLIIKHREYFLANEEACDAAKLRKNPGD